MDIESLILSNLVYNIEYSRKVLIFLKEEYFTQSGTKIVFGIIKDHFLKYNACPIIAGIAIEAGNISGINQPAAKEVELILNKLVYEDSSLDWLIDSTEKFCKDRAVYLAIVESIEITEGIGKRSVDAIPEILNKALSVCFDDNVGVNYTDSAEDRYDFFNNEDTDKIPFSLKMLDLITKNGFARKTLNLVVSASGGGKSLLLCNHAANCMAIGKNVLFITLEMSTEAIAQRIDANLLDTPIDELYTNGKIQYLNKFEKIAAKTRGQLYIKEYPISTGHCGHFKALIEELRMKREFVPDIIIVDYLNICASSTSNGNVAGYERVKNIGEELRSLAQKTNLPIFSAIQFNRSAVGNNDPDMSNIADSYALAMVADWMLALVSNEALASLDQIMCIQIKNRYTGINNNTKFVMGLDKSRMKFYDVEDDFQENNLQPPVVVKSSNRKSLTSFIKD
jgi:archaellum biogenesis ATPase FlaH